MMLGISASIAASCRAHSCTWLGQLLDRHAETRARAAVRLPSLLSCCAALTAEPHAFSGGASARTLEAANATITMGAAIHRFAGHLTPPWRAPFGIAKTYFLRSRGRSANSMTIRDSEGIHRAAPTAAASAAIVIAPFRTILPTGSR